MGKEDGKNGLGSKSFGIGDELKLRNVYRRDIDAGSIRKI